MNDDKLGCLCRISIHKDILHEKEDKNQLYELVLEKFFKSPGVSILDTVRIGRVPTYSI